ncbi:MAG: sigma-54-dependent transcriptional regulator [Bacteroidales bacterium]
MNKPEILILDDEPGFREEIGEFLTQAGYHTHPAGLPSEALAILEKTRVDLALFDVRLPEMDGLTLLHEVKKKYPAMDIVIMTGFGSMDSVIKALRSGATDFLKKPFKFRDVQVILDRILKFRSLHRFHSSSMPEDHFEWADPRYKVIGESAGIKNALNQVAKVAVSDDATVLITGESGTGKELMAHAIHSLSGRKEQPFIAINCSNIPEELFENEFFGHVKGSFTDAKADQQGFFEAANKGTLFLDEIGDLRLSLQSKLLRVIEDKRISRIGTVKEKKVDVRIVAATNQDLKSMMESKTFRADLFHRLNMFSLHIPPLRERRDDIPLLTDYFFEMFGKKYRKPIKKIDRSVYRRLLEHPFPGNVRELKNLIEKAVILCECDTIDGKCFAFDVPLIESEKDALKNLNTWDASLELEVVEKKLIILALEESGFNKSKAAGMLHITRQAIDRKISRYKIPMPGK